VGKKDGIDQGWPAAVQAEVQKHENLHPQHHHYNVGVVEVTQLHDAEVNDRHGNVPLATAKHVVTDKAKVQQQVAVKQHIEGLIDAKRDARCQEAERAERKNNVPPECKTLLHGNGQGKRP
jgi:hypothetical protein